MPVNSQTHSNSIVNKIRNKTQKFVNEDNAIAKVLAFIEDRLNVSREYSLYAGLSCLFLYLAFGWKNDFLCDLIAIIYPGLCSISAIESKSLSDDTEWLMYWAVYGCLHIMDYFQEIIFFWLPFYFLFKCVVLVWMMVPGPNGGSRILYERIVRPYFLKHSTHIEPMLDMVKGNLDEMNKAKTFLNDKMKQANNKQYQ